MDLPNVRFRVTSAKKAWNKGSPACFGALMRGIRGGSGLSRWWGTAYAAADLATHRSPSDAGRDRGCRGPGRLAGVLPASARSNFGPFGYPDSVGELGSGRPRPSGVGRGSGYVRRLGGCPRSVGPFGSGSPGSGPGGELGSGPVGRSGPVGHFGAGRSGPLGHVGS